MGYELGDGLPGVGSGVVPELRKKRSKEEERDGRGGDKIVSVIEVRIRSFLYSSFEDGGLVSRGDERKIEGLQSASSLPEERCEPNEKERDWGKRELVLFLKGRLGQLACSSESIKERKMGRTAQGLALKSNPKKERVSPALLRPSSPDDEKDDLRRSKLTSLENQDRSAGPSLRW